MITITEEAREKIVDVLIGEGLPYCRFGLEGGGCSGMSYIFSPEKEKDDDDIVIPLYENYAIIIDPISSEYLKGTEIDYKRDRFNESFVFNNPNQTTSCGCGQSVSF